MTTTTEYIASMCDEDVATSLHRVALLLPLLSYHNTHTAKEYLKLVFHMVLNLKPAFLSKVACVVSCMQLQTVFKKDDLRKLSACLQQWMYVNKDLHVHNKVPTIDTN